MKTQEFENEYVSSKITLENHLENLCNVYKEYRVLVNFWEISKQKIENVLNSVAMLFPHYSMHDASHSRSVLLNIERILGEKRILQLGPTETWLILLSAYSHDMGMLIKRSDLKKVWSSQDFKEYIQKTCENLDDPILKQYATMIIEYTNNPNELVSNDWPVDIQWGVTLLSADYFRSKHADTSKKYILDSLNHENVFNLDYSFSNLIPSRLMKLLGEIVSLHTKNFESLYSLRDRENGIGADTIYPRRVAELLRLGDLLDLDNGRFNESVRALYGNFPYISELNEKKHQAITHFFVNEDKIEVTADCPDEETFKVVQDWFFWLSEEVKQLSLHWNDIMASNFGAPPSLPWIKIYLCGKQLKNDKLTRFYFDQKDIFELLKGANIYRSKYTFFRELIQNSLDASKLRLWQLIEEGVYNISPQIDNVLLPGDIPESIYNLFAINVTICYRTQEQVYEICVADHGIGIDENALINLSHVAKSWKEREEWKAFILRMPNWLRPTGGFGLGLQSVFNMSNRIECRSKKSGKSTVIIVLKDFQIGGYVTCQQCNDELPVGTEIKFKIPKNKCNVESYHVLGRYASALDKYDIFGEEKGLSIYNMMDCIFSEVGQSLFPIKITAKIDDDVIFKENIPLLPHFPAPLSVLDSVGNIFGNIDYKLGKINLYDVFYGIYMECRILKDEGYKLDESFHGHSTTLFKGMNLKNTVYSSSFCGYLNLSIHLDGFDSKEYITLNRETIRRNKINEVCQIIHKDLTCGIKYYLEHIMEHKTDFECANVNFSSAMLLNQFVEMNSNNADLKHYLYQRINNVISVFHRTENVWKKEIIPINKILIQLMNRKMIYFLDSYILYSEPINWEFLNETLNNMNDFPNDMEYIIVFKRFKDLGVLGHYESLYIVNTEEEKEIFIYGYSASNELQIPNMNDKAEQHFLKLLRSKTRMVIPGIERYKNLIVKKSIWSMSSYFMGKFYQGTYIISPFIWDDLECIKQGISDTELKKKIVARNDFCKLVNYVKLENLNPNVTEDAIKNDYEQLISDVVKLKKINF